MSVDHPEARVPNYAPPQLPGAGTDLYPRPTVPAAARVDFWRRQLLPRITVAQTLFDLIFGVALPIVCLVLDPGIIRSNSFQPQAWRGYGPFAYPFLGLAMVCLVFWLVWRRGARLLSGMFTTFALFALGLGMVLLPLTLVGLLFVIGVLGLCPFSAAFVYGRNAVRAGQQAREKARPGAVVGWAVLGAGLSLLPLAPATYAGLRFRSALSEILAADPSTRQEAAASLRRFAFGGDPDLLLDAYEKTRNAATQEVIARTYKDITRQSLQEALLERED